MLPIPAAAGALFPVQSQLAAVTLPKYRELLRKLKANASVEESSSAFQQAKERVLLRLQQRRWGLGPRRGSGTCGDVRGRAVPRLAKQLSRWQPDTAATPPYAASQWQLGGVCVCRPRCAPCATLPRPGGSYTPSHASCWLRGR